MPQPKIMRLQRAVRLLATTITYRESNDTLANDRSADTHRIEAAQTRLI